jgi:hypothetical protein
MPKRLPRGKLEEIKRDPAATPDLVRSALFPHMDRSQQTELEDFWRTQQEGAVVEQAASEVGGTDSLMDLLSGDIPLVPEFGENLVRGVAQGASNQALALGEIGSDVVGALGGTPVPEEIQQDIQGALGTDEQLDPTGFAQNVGSIAAQAPLLAVGSPAARLASRGGRMLGTGADIGARRFLQTNDPADAAITGVTAGLGTGAAELLRGAPAALNTPFVGRTERQAQQAISALSKGDDVVEAGTRVARQGIFGANPQKMAVRAQKQIDVLDNKLMRIAGRGKIKHIDKDITIRATDRVIARLRDEGLFKRADELERQLRALGTSPNTSPTRALIELRRTLDSRLPQSMFGKTGESTGLNQLVKDGSDAARRSLRQHERFRNILDDMSAAIQTRNTNRTFDVRNARARPNQRIAKDRTSIPGLSQLSQAAGSQLVRTGGAVALDRANQAGIPGAAARGGAIAPSFLLELLGLD